MSNQIVCEACKKSIHEIIDVTVDPNGEICTFPCHHIYHITCVEELGKSKIDGKFKCKKENCAKMPTCKSVIKLQATRRMIKPMETETIEILNAKLQTAEEECLRIRNESIVNIAKAEEAAEKAKQELKLMQIKFDELKKIRDQFTNAVDKGFQQQPAIDPPQPKAANDEKQVRQSRYSQYKDMNARGNVSREQSNESWSATNEFNNDRRSSMPFRQSDERNRSPLVTAQNALAQAEWNCHRTYSERLSTGSNDIATHTNKKAAEETKITCFSDPKYKKRFAERYNTSPHFLEPFFPLNNYPENFMVAGGVEKNNKDSCVIFAYTTWIIGDIHAYNIAKYLIGKKPFYYKLNAEYYQIGLTVEKLAKLVAKCDKLLRRIMLSIGSTDIHLGTTTEAFKDNMKKIFQTFEKCGVQMVFLLPPIPYRGESQANREQIIEALNENWGEVGNLHFWRMPHYLDILTHVQPTIVELGPIYEAGLYFPVIKEIRKEFIPVVKGEKRTIGTMLRLPAPLPPRAKIPAQINTATEPTNTAAAPTNTATTTTATPVTPMDTSELNTTQGTSQITPEGIVKIIQSYGDQMAAIYQQIEELKKSTAARLPPLSDSAIIIHSPQKPAANVGDNTSTPLPTGNIQQTFAPATTTIGNQSPPEERSLAFSQFNFDKPTLPLTRCDATADSSSPKKKSAKSSSNKSTPEKGSGRSKSQTGHRRKLSLTEDKLVQGCQNEQQQSPANPSAKSSAVETDQWHNDKPYGAEEEVHVTEEQEKKLLDQDDPMGQQQ